MPNPFDEANFQDKKQPGMRSNKHSVEAQLRIGVIIFKIFISISEIQFGKTIVSHPFPDIPKQNLSRTVLRKATVVCVRMMNKRLTLLQAYAKGNSLFFGLKRKSNQNIIFYPGLKAGL